MTPLIIIGCVLFLVIIIPIAIYNSLINRKNTVDYAFGTIDVMLKKRRDLIPNLISTVKQYTTHEKSLLENIVRLRNIVSNGEVGSKEQFENEGLLGQAIRQIMVVVENYPDLKANQNFLHLQASLNETEEQISAARRAYNAAILDYNNGLEMFPSNIFAKMLNYKPKFPFKISEEERKNIDVASLFE